MDVITIMQISVMFLISALCKVFSLIASNLEFIFGRHRHALVAMDDNGEIDVMEMDDAVNLMDAIEFRGSVTPNNINTLRNFLFEIISVLLILVFAYGYAFYLMHAFYNSAIQKDLLLF